MKMKFILCFFMVMTSLELYSQKNKHISIAFMNASTAKPFSHFGRLLTRIQQPGVELSYGFNWKTKTRHDWYQEIKIAYFYHRFVQHAVPVYTHFGYRYKFNKKWAAQSALGIGYMHSIPATAQLKLGSNGQYTKAKGIGRMQGLASFNIGGSYVFSANQDKPVTLFVTYQQIIQTPFINAYVPLLPYNSILLGIAVPLQSKN